MHFLCLCHYEVAKFAALGADEFGRIRERCAPHDQALYASGHVRLVGSLASQDAYRTLRAHGDTVTVDTGPYARSDEPFGAFFLIEAEDIDEAVRIAMLHPGAHLGSVFGGGIEVRPLDRFIEP